MTDLGKDEAIRRVQGEAADLQPPAQPERLQVLRFAGPVTMVTGVEGEPVAVMEAACQSEGTPVAIVTGVEGEPVKVLMAACQSVVIVRAWFNADGRLLRAEFPPSLLDKKIIVGGLSARARYQVVRATGSRSPNLVAAVLREAGLPEWFVDSQVALERKARRSERGRPYDPVGKWAEHWRIWLEAVGLMASGAARKDACRIVEGWNRRKEISKVIPRLSAVKQFAIFKSLLCG